MPVFMYELKLSNPDNLPLSIDETAIIQEHFNYLKMLVQDGRVLLAGRCQDIAFGIVLYRAGTFEEAEEIMNADPAVAKRVMKATCHAFQIALISDPEEFLAHS